MPVPGLTSHGTTSLFARSQYVGWPITLAAALAASSGLLAAPPAIGQQPPAAVEQRDELARPEAEAGQAASGQTVEEAVAQPPVEPQPAAEPELAVRQPLAESAPTTPPVEPAAEAEKELPKKLGPARIETGAGHLDLTFALQLLGTVLAKDTGDEYETTFGVEPRRLRLYPRGSFLDGSFQFGVQINTTPSSLELLDWWMDGRILDQLQVRLGQYKIPFSRYRQQSFSKCLLVDWGNVTRYFGAERQIGIMLHNGDARPEWEYAVGLFNGQNSRKSHGLGPSEVYAVTVTNPSDLRTTGPLEDKDKWHPELVARLMHNSGDNAPFSPSDSEGGALRHVFALSATWDNLPDDPELTTRNDLVRLAPEMLLKAYGMAFVGAVYLGVERTAVNEKTELGMLGWLGELAYRFESAWEVAARLSRVDFLRELREDAKDYAAEQIAAAAGSDEEDAVTSQYSKVGASEAVQELALGLNVYIVESDLKLQTDVALLSNYLDGAETRNDFRWRTQLQLAF